MLLPALVLATVFLLAIGWSLAHARRPDTFDWPTFALWAGLFAAATTIGTLIGS